MRNLNTLNNKYGSRTPLLKMEQNNIFCEYFQQMATSFKGCTGTIDENMLLTCVAVDVV